MQPSILQSPRPPSFSFYIPSTDFPQICDRIALLLHRRPQLLQVLNDRHIGVHEAVDTVLCALLLAPVQLTRSERSSDALLEADICERVNGW